MAKSNGKPEVEPQPLDTEHELPAAEPEGVAAEAQAEELAKLRAERDELYDRLARAQAEFENARRRAAREQEEFRNYAAAGAVKELLPILDSFDRALKAPAAGLEEFRAGLELINRQMHDALAKLGVVPIEAEGQPFDPRFHEAVEMVDTDQAPDHQVLDELQRGYRIKDRLLRPAMVRVARNSKP